MFLLAAILWMQAQDSVRHAPPRAARPGPSANADMLPPRPIPVDVAARQFGLAVSVSPDTVTVGQRFTVTVRVRVPAALAASVQLPGTTTANPELTTSDDAVQRRARLQDGLVETTATYQLAAWDVGRIPIGLADLVVGETHVDLSAVPVVVRSTLPQGATARLKAKPRPPRETFPVIVILRRIVRQVVHDRRFVVGSIVTLSLLAIAGIAWLLWARARRRRDLMAQLVWAEREFARIEKLHLLEKGEPERYSILMTNVLRQLLSRQFPDIPASATTTELKARLQHQATVPAARTLQLFERIDMLKFARRNIAVPAAQTVGIEDRAIVREIKERHEAAIAEAARRAAPVTRVVAGGKT